MVCVAMLCFCNGKTYRLTSVLNWETGEVRHLLVDEFNGHAHTDLILVTAGRDEKLFSGTQCKSLQGAHNMGQAWVKTEEFDLAKGDQPPYEPLAHAVKLVMRLGENALFDPTLVHADPRNPDFNATGRVQFKEGSLQETEKIAP
jgi:hypothetical protein